jgi:pimeloyl-ACP methyl ester carboxylesterase
VPDDGGRDTALTIPGAELLLIEGMGHSFPREVWPRIIDAIARHASKADAADAAPAPVTARTEEYR